MRSLSDTDDYARVALPAAAAPSAAAAAADDGGGGVNGLSEESNNESCSDDLESVIESEQGVVIV